MPKYYIVPNGCMGFINGNYQLFVTEREYFETLRGEIYDSTQN